VGTLRFAHPADVPDGQIPDTRHAQIARRANLPQQTNSDFRKMA
jgi:hypothetical protein